MAIIKCPECGHQISDKAPTCPSCGIEIADKVTRCPECGETFFRDEIVCPNCHHPASSTPVAAPATAVPVRDSEPTPRQGTPEKPATTPKKKRNIWIPLLVSFFIALLFCGICFYMYQNAQDNKEQQEYEFAIKSEEPLVLQSYLDTYKDAPKEHIDAINKHFQEIKQRDHDWRDACISNSKSMLQDYLKKYPNSTHRAEAVQIIDSLDWAQASSLNTVEAYNAYLNEHDPSDHYEEAKDRIKKLKTQTVTDEERSMVAQLFRRFFISINERDEQTLTSSVAEGLTLLGKQQASKNDVILMMNKMYKEDVEKIIWRINKDYNISKREIGDGQYEYAVTFTANEEVQKTDSEQRVNTQYRIQSRVNPEGCISELQLAKVVE